MIKLAVYNTDGQEVESLKVDEAVLGGSVRYSLLKQAVVMYHANKRVGTAATKSRSMVAGSDRKLFRQKGTGNARVGNIRTGKRKGGGVTFAKTPRDFSKSMPKKQRRLAMNSAILAKLLRSDVVVVDGLNFDKPKTKDFAGILGNLKIDRSCLVTVSSENVNLYKSANNIPKVDVMPVSELNAGDICRHRKMLFTKEAFLDVLNREQTSGN
ncbi:MAG: 50S ribosomal protein L4 [Planctomycetes bacterium]|jgi:large subunit ribosomal protein L4|nr:50S ribosomal protein L4 [Planctomycetota bacterium]MBL7144174.1 50S ribosomal protein L4 [Phycisphaerae bacterium]